MIGCRLFTLLDRITLPSFLPSAWHDAYYRWTLAGMERANVVEHVAYIEVELCDIRDGMRVMEQELANLATELDAMGVEWPPDPAEVAFAEEHRMV